MDGSGNAETASDGPRRRARRRGVVLALAAAGALHALALGGLDVDLDGRRPLPAPPERHAPALETRWIEPAAAPLVAPLVAPLPETVAAEAAAVPSVPLANPAASEDARSRKTGPSPSPKPTPTPTPRSTPTRAAAPPTVAAAQTAMAAQTAIAEPAGPVELTDPAEPPRLRPASYQPSPAGPRPIPSEALPNPVAEPLPAFPVEPPPNVPAASTEPSTEPPAATRRAARLRLAAAASEARAEALSPESEPIPHYRTRPAPSVDLRYDVRRGLLSGTGDIHWKNDGTHYDLRLQFRYAGLTILEQTSSGAFDAEGLAPQRFVDQRIRRAAMAANFQRDAHKLTYSGTQDEFPLRPGAQDRLSWMLQLAAIVAAEPALAQPGGRVTMFITGARGDVGVWTFRALGAETLATRAGAIAAVKFVREARYEHDLTIQVWLDPARHYLPAGAVQQAGPNDEAYELRLIEAIEPR